MSDQQGEFAQLSKFVARVDLRGIVAQECHAVRHSGAAPERAAVSLDTALSFRPGAVDYRFTLTCQAFDASDEPVADLSVVLLTSFIFDGEEASESVYEAFGTNVAVMTAYPYLRQHIHDLAGRIGLVNFTLGLLKQPNKAQGFSIVATGPSQ
ncbi:hypothetical protein [Streptomyces sp. Root264]|uniref:hypothetical protein n=1 Tax=Streptomyces sp. Root264 TaxID=1736503 RepID=UPI0012FF5265|nr:hypothetical protein [Streptomyces sp. Root264]